LEGESLVTPISPKVSQWSRPRTLEDFPTLGFTTPCPIIILSFKEETYTPSSPMTFSPNTQSTLISPRGEVPLSPVQTPYPPSSPPTINHMEGSNPPRNKMDSIVAARYAPLILPQLMNALPFGDYLKYMPKFIGEEDITIEEHLSPFYSYADNLNIENKDVWMRVFLQILDDEVRKWFRGFVR
jgi:hypothetical protein